MTGASASGDDRYDWGLATRRAVLGDAYVDAALGRLTEVTAPLDEYVTTACWADLWGRPGLSHRDRSLLNLGILAAANRLQELRTHVRGALRNGIIPAELTEVILQVAVYCGAPAALDTARTVQAVLTEADE